MRRFLQKTIYLIAISGLSVGLCACQKKDASDDSKNAADVQKQENTVANEKTDKKADTEANSETDSEVKNGENASNADEKQDGDVKIIHPIVFHKQLVCSMPASWERGVSCEYDVFTLTDDDKKEYPRLSKALVKFENDLESQAESAFSNMRDAMEENYSALSPDDEYTLVLEDNSLRKVVRSDSVAFSVFCDSYNYYGGAHPYYAFTGYNFDSQTGHELSCEDVVSDVDKLNNILFEKLMAEYGDECSLNEETVREHLLACKTGESDYEWLLGYEGITFYFNPYSLTSYAGGMQIVYLSFADYPEIFSKTYQKIPANYIEPFCSYSDIYTDIDQDGKVEKISATANGTENENNELDVYITIDDENYTFNYDDSFSGDLYLVHYDKKCYIYNFISGMGTSEMIQCYDLSDGTAKNMKRHALGRHVMVADDYIDKSETSGLGDETITEYYTAEEIFTDPNHFRMSNWLNALSTCDGVAEFSIDKEGLPCKDSVIYDVSRDWWIDAGDSVPYLEFTTRMELSMSKLDANGNITDDISIPKGTKLIYIRTDEKTFADFRLEDGSEVRAKIKCDDFPQEICGEDLEEALDGTLFAG